MADGTIKIGIDLDDKGLSGKADEVGKDAGSRIASGLQAGASKAGEVMATIAKVGAAGLAVAGTAAVALGKQSIEMYSEWEQQVGGVETLYKDAAGKVQQYAAQAYKTAGLSATEYMRTSTSFAAALVKSCGGSTQQAADLANQAIIDMSDNANIMGSDMSMIQQTYQSLSRGNYAMLDNLKLGYGGTKSEMERLISDANEYEKAQGRAGDLTIDSFADQVQAIHDVQEQMGITGDTAREAAGTIQGSMQMAKAAWDNWLTGLSNPDADMGQLTDQLLDAVGAVINNVAPRVAAVAQAIVQKLPGMMQQVADKLGPLLADGVASAINGISDTLHLSLPPIDGTDVEQSVQGVADVIGGIIGGIGEALQSLADGFMSTFSDSGLGDAIQGLIDALGPFYETVLVPLGDLLGGPIATAVGYVAGIIGTQLVQALTDIIVVVTAVIEAITATVQQWTDAFNAIASNPTIQSIVATIQDWWYQTSTAVMMIVGAVQQAWSTTVGVVQGGVSAIGSVISSGMAVAQGLFSAAWSAIQGVASWAASGISSVMQGMASFVAGIPGRIAGAFGVLSSIGGYASSAAGTVSSIFSGMASTVASIPGRIVGYFAGLGSRISAAFGSIHFPTPHISWSSIDVMGVSVSLPYVQWYKAGGLFAPGMPQLIGIGDNPRYDEAALPLSPDVLGGIGRGIAQYMPQQQAAGATTIYNINGITCNDIDMVNTSIYDFLRDIARYAGR